ncbi:MAG: hypothetical protein GY699_18470 [Desulfobacteraceae bacterium]|nr:hypothetical protein [Desulfobacteraceae bacterium]
MKIKIVFSIIVFTFFLCNIAIASIVEDQNNWNFTNSAFSNTGTVLTQTITQGVTGKLAEIKISLHDFVTGGSTETIFAKISTGTQMYTEQEIYITKGGGYNNSSDLIFDFLSQDIFLNTGDSFELSLYGLNTGLQIYFNYDWTGSYSRGVFVGQSERDLIFMTYVDVQAVPIPSTIGLFGLGLLGLAGIARTKKQKQTH